MNTRPLAPRPRSGRKRILFACLPALFACAPAVTHGPRVERGLALVATGGIPRTLCAADCTAGVIPTLGAGARYGWVPGDPARPSYQLGALVPVWDPVGFELDGFVQAPSRDAWAYGAGSLVSSRHLVPYVEIGNLPAAGGEGWYLSLARAWLFADPTRLVGSRPGEGEFGMAQPPRFWSPGGGVRLARDDGNLTFFANASLGSYVDREARYPSGDATQPVGVDVRKPVRVLIVGLAADLAPRGFRRLRLPPSRPVPVPRPVPEPH